MREKGMDKGERVVSEEEGRGGGVYVLPSTVGAYKKKKSLRLCLGINL